MCYSLCILLGAPRREEPLKVVLDLWRARSGVEDLLAGGVHSRTREAPGAQPMSVQSVARVLLRAEEGDALLALDAHLGHSKFLERMPQGPLSFIVVTIVAVDLVDVRRADGAGLDRSLCFWWWWWR